MASFLLSTSGDYGICVGEDAKTRSGKALKCRALFCISFSEQRLRVQTVLGGRVSENTQALS